METSKLIYLHHGLGELEMSLMRKGAPGAVAIMMNEKITPISQVQLIIEKLIEEEKKRQKIIQGK